MNDQERLQKFTEIKQRIYTNLVISGMNEKEADVTARDQAANEFRQLEEAEKEKCAERAKIVKDAIYQAYRDYGNKNYDGSYLLTNIEGIYNLLKRKKPDLNLTFNEAKTAADHLYAEGIFTYRLFDKDIDKNGNKLIKHKYYIVKKITSGIC